MRYSVTPELAQKVAQLRVDHDAMEALSQMLRTIENASDRSELLPSLEGATVVLEDGVFVYRTGNLRVFFSFGEDYVLLLDVTLAASRPSLATRKGPAVTGPSADRRLNPKYNTLINPKYNASINPKYNASINPKYNASINPKYNASINPKYNASINPKYNTSINPKYNTSINPKYNNTLNPKRNPSYSGPYIYDLDLRREGFLVRANERVEVAFNELGETIGLVVLVDSSEVAVVFDEKLNWSGYLVKDGQGGFLRFDTGAQWNGVVV